LIAMMNYDGLRAEQAELRKKGIYRGIGIASFIEVTNPSAAFYGVGVRAYRLRMALPCGSMPRAA
jgi:carbon-monoxide dehydrogenase large subunit